MSSLPAKSEPLIWLADLTDKYLEFARELRNANKEYFFSSNNDITPDQMITWYGSLVGSQTYHRFFIVTKDSEPIGTISIKLPGTSEDPAIIGNVLITQNERGNGYGEKAVRLALGTIAAYGRQYARLEIIPGNRHAIEFYKKLGFYEKSLTMEWNGK